MITKTKKGEKMDSQTLKDKRDTSKDWYQVMCKQSLYQEAKKNFLLKQRVIPIENAQELMEDIENKALSEAFGTTNEDFFSKILSAKNDADKKAREERIEKQRKFSQLPNTIKSAINCINNNRTVHNIRRRGYNVKDTLSTQSKNQSRIFRPVTVNKSCNSEKIAQATKDIDKATTTKNEVGTQQKL